MGNTSGIYCILNLINGKRYIGQTINLKKREHDHFRHLKYNKHRNPHLQYAFNQYGLDNFAFIIITYCSENELDDLEQFYIKQFNTMDRKYGYNLDSGGTLNKKLSNESVEKMSKTLSERYNSVGFYRVYKQNKKDAAQGFQWCYKFHKKNGERVQIRSIDLMKVKEKVISKGLDWFIVDEELANKSIEENNNNLKKNKKGNNSGFYRVHYDENHSTFHYQFTENHQHFSRSRVDLDDLEQEILAEGLEWRIIDKDKANKSIEINEDNKKRKKNSDKNKKSYKKLNKSGFYRVFKFKCTSCSKGFTWGYLTDEHKTIKSVDIFKLKEKVLSRGFVWEIIDEEKAKASIEYNNQEIQKKEKNKTGFYRVLKLKNSSKKGFCWAYCYDENNKKHISADNLNELKDKVLSNCLEWKITDKEKAKNSWNRDNGIIPHILNNSRNKTGLLRVSMSPCKRCMNGFIWTYAYGNESISSVDLDELKKRVLDKNWEWKILDEEKAKKSFRNNAPKIIKTTNSGFYKVSKVKRKNCTQGFTWRYYNEKLIQSTNLLTLKNKVVSEGLEWKIIDEKLARESVKLHNSYNHNYDAFEKFDSVNRVKQKMIFKNPNSDVISSIKKEGTGFFRVYLYENKSFANGIQWRYFNADKEFTSVDLLELKNKVISNGFEWKIIDEKKAKISLKLNAPKKERNTNSGFYKVSKTKCKNCKKEFTWAYYGKRTIRSINLFDLKSKVTNEGLEWKVEDIKKAKESVAFNNGLYGLDLSLQDYC